MVLAKIPNGLYNNDGRYFSLLCSVQNKKDALDGQWHHVAFTRKRDNGIYKQYEFYFDGKIEKFFRLKTDQDRLKKTLDPYFELYNLPQVVIGNCDNEQETYRQFVGIIEDVTIWNRALSQDEIQRTRFNETNPNDPGLVGFWKLDQNFDDSSPIRNNGSAEGAIELVEVAHQAKRQQSLKITEGTPYLYGVALDKSKSSVTFPEGALVKVFRPDGMPLDKDSSTDDLFVKMNGNSVWAFTVKNPQAGDWRFAVECPTSTPFLLSIQTTPSTNLGFTIENTLKELYDVGRSLSVRKIMTGVTIAALRNLAVVGGVVVRVGVGGAIAALMVALGIIKATTDSWLFP